MAQDFPRTTPRLNRMVPNEHPGQMKLWATNAVGLTGALININSLLRNNLRHLTLTTSAQLMIPVRPPMCH